MLAAMASEDGCDVRRLSLKMLRRSLKDSGAIIPVPQITADYQITAD